MKETFIIIFNNYRKPVPIIFKEKIDGTVGAQKWSPPNISYVASQKNFKNEDFVWETQQQNFHKKL